MYKCLIPIPVHIKYTYTCSICGATDTQVFNEGVGLEMPWPSPPPGWREVLGQTVCSQHRIEARLRIIDPHGDAFSWALWREVEV